MNLWACEAQTCQLSRNSHIWLFNTQNGYVHLETSILAERNKLLFMAYFNTSLTLYLERKRKKGIGREWNDKKSFFCLFKREMKGKEEKNHFLSKSFHFWRDLIINKIKGTNSFISLPSKSFPSNLLSKESKIYPSKFLLSYLSNSFKPNKVQVYSYNVTLGYIHKSHNDPSDSIKKELKNSITTLLQYCLTI